MTVPCGKSFVWCHGVQHPVLQRMQANDNGNGVVCEQPNGADLVELVS